MQVAHRLNGFNVTDDTPRLFSRRHLLYFSGFPAMAVLFIAGELFLSRPWRERGLFAVMAAGDLAFFAVSVATWLLFSASFRYLGTTIRAMSVAGLIVAISVYFDRPWLDFGLASVVSAYDLKFVLAMFPVGLLCEMLQIEPHIRKEAPFRMTLFWIIGAMGWGYPHAPHPFPMPPHFEIGIEWARAGFTNMTVFVPIGLLLDFFRFLGRRWERLPEQR